MQTAGFDEAAGKLRALVGAEGDVRKASETMGVTIDQSGKSAERAVVQFERAEKRLVGLAREAANTDKNFALMYKAAATGKVPVERLKAFEDAITGASQAAKELAAQQKAADARNFDVATAAMEDRVKQARDAQAAEEKLNQTLQAQAEARNRAAATDEMDRRVKEARDAQVAEERLNETLQDQAEARNRAAATAEMDRRVKEARDAQAAEEKLSQTLQEQANIRNSAAAVGEMERRVRVARDEQAAEEKLTQTLKEQAEARNRVAATSEMERRIQEARDAQAAEERVTKALEDQQVKLKLAEAEWEKYAQLQKAGITPQVSAQGTVSAPADSAAGQHIESLIAQNRALADLKAQARDAANEEARLEAVANELKQRIDPAATAMERFAQKTADADKALAAGKLSGPEHAAALKYLAAEAENASKGIGLSANQIQNLGYQINDVISGLAMGQSPFTVLTQQGGQFYQIIQQSGGGLKEFGGYLANLVTPARVVFGGIAAGVAAAGYAVNQQLRAFAELRSALVGLGSGSGATVGQLNEIAIASSKAGEVSVRAAQTMAAEYARTGMIGSQNIGRLIEITKNFSIATGQDMAAATKMLASSLSDPAKGFADLNAATGAFDAKTQHLVETLQASGDRFGAQRVLIEGVEKATRAATDAMPAYQKAWEQVKNAVSSGVSLTGQQIIKTFGGGTNEQNLQTLLDQRQRIADLAARYGANVQSATAEIDKQIAALQRQIAAERGISEAIAKQVELRSRASFEAASIATQRVPALASAPVESLLGERSTLARGVASGAMTPDQTEFAKRQIEGLNQLINQFGVNASATERMLAQMNTAFVLSINAMRQFNADNTARTAQEQAAAQAEATYQQVLEQTHDTLLANVQAEQTYARALEQSAQAAQATIRGLQNQGQSAALEGRLVGADLQTQSLARARLQAEQTISQPGFDMRFADQVRGAAEALGQLQGAAATASAALSTIRGQQNELADLGLEFQRVTGEISQVDFIRMSESQKAYQTVVAQGIPLQSEEARRIMANADALGDMKVRLAEASGQLGAFGGAIESVMKGMSSGTTNTNWNENRTAGSYSAATPQQVQQAQEQYGGHGTWQLTSHVGGMGGVSYGAYFVPDKEGLDYFNQQRAGGTAPIGAAATTAATNDNYAPSTFAAPTTATTATTPFDTTNALPANASQTMPTLDPYSLKNPEVFYGTNTGLYYGAAGSSGAASIPETLNNQLTTLQSIADYSQQTANSVAILAGQPTTDAAPATGTRTATAPTGTTATPYLGGYATGGSFTMPGSGGGDRLYGIGLAAGERVNVTPRGRSSTAPGQQVVQYITNYISGGPASPERGLVSAETAAQQIRTQNNRAAA